MVVGMSPKMFISDMRSHGLLKSFHHFQSSTRLYTSETTQTVDLVFHCTCGSPLPYLLIGVELAALSQSFHLAGLEVLKIIVADGSGWLRPEMDILDNIVGGCWLLVAGYSAVATTITFLIQHTGEGPNIQETILKVNPLACSFSLDWIGCPLPPTDQQKKKKKRWKRMAQLVHPSDNQINHGMKWEDNR